MTLALDEDGVPDEQILFVRGRKPLRCGLAKYHRRPELAVLADANPFYRSSAKDKFFWHPKDVVAATYATALAVVSLAVASLPLPLSPGDRVMVTTDIPAYNLDGSPKWQKVVSGAVGVIAAPVRSDGFVVVRFQYSGGVMGLLDSRALEQFDD